jgi:alpha-tubulin suppressor-like RCC1 family protein
MTVGVCDLINCVNLSINTVTCDPLTILQLSSVIKDFNDGFVKSVANCAALPDAACNKGRMIYLADTCGYRISDGVSWTNDFTSTIQDFQIWTWGYNGNGQLGDGTTTNRSSPVSAMGGFNNWCQVSAGFFQNMAVRTNGTAWGWGGGAVGVLGDGFTVARSSPVSVVGGFTDWCQVSTSYQHTVAVRRSGSAWAWGNNGSGRLGTNNTTNTSSPVSVVGGFSDWCQISAGRQHTAAVRTNGTAWSWGFNTYGALGNNTTTVRSSPVSVVGGFSDWCQVSGGTYSSVAVRTGGSAWAWGLNGSGILGDNTTTTRSSPVSVVGGFSDWCQASMGGYHTVGVRTSGSAWTWGYNSFFGKAGMLGDNTTENRSSPVSVVGGFTNWCQASASVGGYHTVAVRTNGSVWAWGYNSYGLLGDNTTTNRSSPVSVVGGSTDWYAVSAGRTHTIGLNATRGFV